MVKASLSLVLSLAVTEVSACVRSGRLTSVWLKVWCCWVQLSVSVKLCCSSDMVVMSP